MMYAVYDVNTRQLVYLTDNPSPLVPAPLSAVSLEREDRPDPMLESWNSGSLRFEPVPTVSMTQVEFLRRMTSAEYAAIKAACLLNADLDFYWAKFFAAEYVSPKDPEVVGGLALLEQAGLLGPGRATALLA